MERAGGTATGRRDVFAVDEDAALAELELAWADGGYHGFSADDGTGRRSAAPERCSPEPPRMSWTGRSGRTGRRSSDRGRPVNVGAGRSLGSCHAVLTLRTVLSGAAGPRPSRPT